MAQWTLDAPEIKTVEELYAQIDALYPEVEKAISVVEATKTAWHPRSVKRMEAFIQAIRDFVEGTKVTEDVKGIFYQTSVNFGLEITVRNGFEQAAIYCLTETAHAAAHMGHLNTAANRANTQTEAGIVNFHFAKLQVAYVMFGVRGVQRYAEMVVEMVNKAERKRGRKTA